MPSRAFPPLRRPLLGAAAVLGFALGGFFDGILLHQVLQWHHLLSLVPGEGVQDPRVQILADGAFHVLMYLVAAGGLWLLWRSRQDAVQPGAGASLVVGGLLGFAVWNLVDAVAFHWLLGIHRIRIDTASPLAWDLGWLIAFGLVPALLALAAWRRARSGSGGSGAAAAVVLVVATAGGGAWALRPSDSEFTTVLFPGTMDPAAVMEAVASVDARLVASDPSAQLVVLRLDKQQDRWRLYGRGALIVGGASAAACANWSSPALA